MQPKKSRMTFNKPKEARIASAKTNYGIIGIKAVYRKIPYAPRYFCANQVEPNSATNLMAEFAPVTNKGTSLM
jgi:hypothetical protein